MDGAGRAVHDRESRLLALQTGRGDRVAERAAEGVGSGECADEDEAGLVAGGELRAVRATAPTVNVSVTQVFEGSTAVVVNPPAKPVMTINRAIALLALLLTLIQTYAAVNPDEPSKPPVPQTRERPEEPRPVQPEAKPRPSDGTP